MQQQIRTVPTGRILASGMALALLLGGVPVGAQSGGQKVTLETGTVIPVILENQLTSNKSRKGDRFTAKLKLTDKSYLGLPAGTRLEGVITEAKAKRDKDPGVLDMEFRTLRMPNGKTYPITSELIGLDNKSVETQDDGRIIAKEGRKRDDTKYIGYGAAAGALFSILGNRGRLSLENLILGSAAGYAAGALTPGKKEPRDVTLKEGTEIGVRLDKPVRFTPTDAETIPDEDRAPLTPGKENQSEYGFAVLIGDNNVVFSSTAKPFQAGTTWMLPVKAVLDAAYIRYKYNQSARSLEIMDGDNSSRVGVGSQVVVMNDGSRKRLDKAVRQVNGSLFAPVRYFELTTGMKANYDESSNTLVFEKRDP
jgi:hypothetical protein